MRIGFLITARLKSSRLKLKLLKQLNGYSVIDRVIQRAKQVKACDDIILCTSENNQDLPLVRTALVNNICYFNGDSDDVLDRLYKASNLFNLDYIICMTADNPLFSIHYANLISDKIRSHPEIDYIYTDSLPIGVNVYALKTKALKVICSIKEEMDTEIWGSLINRPDIFNVSKLKVDDSDKIDIDRITLDESEDYELIHQIFEKFPKDYLIEESDIRNIIKKHPYLREINSGVVQRQLDQKTIDRIDRFFTENKEDIVKLKNKIYRDDD
jgi:spore coat polysaccharide biosynthesis protein SpsF